MVTQVKIMCGNPERVELEPTGMPTTRGDHRAGVQLHHQRSGLKANQEGVESSRSVALARPRWPPTTLEITVVMKLALVISNVIRMRGKHS